MRRIYFAGSITGGRQQASTYVAIIAELRSHGRVLTEHVGDSHLDGAGETALDAQEIFLRDVAWVDTSDALVADVTVPSLGVGYEIGRAEARGIPVLALFDRSSGRKLSAMVSGNAAVRTMDYATAEEAQACVRAYFASLDAEAN